MNFVVFVKSGAFGENLAAFRASRFLHLVADVGLGFRFRQRRLLALAAKGHGSAAVVVMKFVSAFLFPAKLGAVFAVFPIEFFFVGSRHNRVGD